MGEPARWLKGELVGACVGKPHRKVGGSGLARWYKLELVEAVISNWAPVAGPPKGVPEGGQAPFCQAKLRDARLRSLSPGGPDEELSVRELSVWDWKLRDQREGGGESRGTLVGTVYAQEVSGTRRPARPEGADRLDRWGCLALLAALFAAFVLWWSCGPFTCGLWAAVVLASAWSHRLRTRRRTPPTLASQIVQGLLAFGLIVGGVGLALGLSDPALASSCGDTPALYVLAALAVVVAGSLLTVSWPLPWIWIVWTVVLGLWCGRSGTDCAALVLKRVQQTAGPGTSRQRSVIDELRRRITGEPAIPASFEPSGPGTGTSGPGPDREPGPAPGAGPGTGTGEPGSGTGTGAGGTGSGGTGSGGTGSGGTGSGGTGSGGTGSGGTGSGDTGSGGTGSGGTGTGPGLNQGVGNGPPGAQGPGDNGGLPESRGGQGRSPAEEEAPEAAGEKRMSVDAALSDPKPFLDGSTRITLSGDLLFSFDEDTLKPEAEPRLRQVAKLLRLDPSARVLLEGHADTVGGDQYNQELSERRAQAVRTWLVQQAHISPLQIDTVGYGSAKPLVPASKGPAAQQANRRVEVRVLSTGD